MRFWKDNRGFVTIAMSLMLPFILALIAIAIDLGNSLRNHSRLTNSLRESSLMMQANGDLGINVADKAKELASVYLDGKEIENIRVSNMRARSSQGQQDSTYMVMTAEIVNNGIFTGFVNRIDNKDIRLAGSSKLESTKDLAFTDFVFAVAFTRSAINDDALGERARRDVCSGSNSKLIPHGICNPPIPSRSQVIDASQTIVANMIKIAKSFDRDNNQFFGFVPYGFGVQVRGSQLTNEADIDKTDGLTQSQRDQALYVIYPFDFAVNNFRSMDFYSRFYPADLLVQGSTRILDDRVLRGMERAGGANGGSVNLFRGFSTREFFLNRFKLDPENDALAGRTDIPEGLEAVKFMFDNSFTPGDPMFLNTARTVSNVFSEKYNLVWRVYNPNVDRITLNKDIDSIRGEIEKFEQAAGAYRAALADVNALNNTIKNSKEGEKTNSMSLMQSKMEIEMKANEINMKIEEVINKSSNSFFARVCINDGEGSSFGPSILNSLCPSLAADAWKPESKMLVAQYKEEKKKIAEVDKLITSLNGRSLGELLNEASAKRDQKLGELNTAKVGIDNSVTITGKALCVSIAAYTEGRSCQTRAGNDMKFTETDLRKIKDLSNLREIEMLWEQPFDISNMGTYIASTGEGQDYGSVGLIRSALMLVNHKTGNPNAKILVFTSTVNDLDEQLFDAGLCDTIREGVKNKAGVDVEIYAISLGLPKPSETLSRLNTAEYMRVWSKCTKNVILGETVDKLFAEAQKSVFQNFFGQFTRDKIQ